MKDGCKDKNCDVEVQEKGDKGDNDVGVRQGDSTEVILDSGGDGAVVECQFRRGTCLNHNIKGRKMTKTSSHWAKKKNGEFGWSYRKKVYYKCEYRPATILSPISISDISPTCGRAQGDMNSDSDFVQISGSSLEECKSESGLTQISITTPEG